MSFSEYLELYKIMWDYNSRNRTTVLLNKYNKLSKTKQAEYRVRSLNLELKGE